MTALLAVGIALVVFGSIVLLRFPERPGGRIAWQGFEVSSVGAGLPLIAVGVAAVALAAGGVDLGGGANGEEEASTTTAGEGTGDGSCFAGYFEGIPAGRVFTLEDGVQDRDVVGTTEPKAGPFGLRLNADGAAIGAIRMGFFPENGLFRIQSVVDAVCRPVEDYGNLNQPGTDKHALPNFNDLGVRLGGRSYLLKAGGGATIRLSFFRVEE
jgi:hypothetical protein